MMKFLYFSQYYSGEDIITPLLEGYPGMAFEKELPKTEGINTEYVLESSFKINNGVRHTFTNADIYTNYKILSSNKYDYLLFVTRRDYFKSFVAFHLENYGEIPIDESEAVDWCVKKSIERSMLFNMVRNRKKPFAMVEHSELFSSGLIDDTVWRLKDLLFKLNLSRDFIHDDLIKKMIVEKAKRDTDTSHAIIENIKEVKEIVDQKLKLLSL